MQAVSFDQLQQLTLQMLGAAQQGDWDALVEVEQARTTLVADWQAGRVRVEGVQAAGLAAVLATDVEIRQLVQARQQEIGRLLGDMRAGQRMNQAYLGIAGSF